MRRNGRYIGIATALLVTFWYVIKLTPTFKVLTHEGWRCNNMELRLMKFSKT